MGDDEEARELLADEAVRMVIPPLERFVAKNREKDFTKNITKYIKMSPGVSVSTKSPNGTRIRLTRARSTPGTKHSAYTMMLSHRVGAHEYHHPHLHPGQSAPVDRHRVTIEPFPR